jgi:hypothetical protein
MSRRHLQTILSRLVRVVPLAALAAVACSIAVRRDLSTVPVGQIGFDDMCGLQDYFDTIDAKGGSAPTLVKALELEGQSEGKTVRGGRARYAFEGDFQLKHLRRVLNENWQRLPDQLATASRVELSVRWAEKAGVRRVVTDQDAELSIGNESWSLPYQVCLSELLYGEPLYRQRRAMWGLPFPGAPAKPPAVPPPAAASAPGDAGAASDGGAAASSDGHGN